MSAMSRKDYLLIARAIRDSEAAYDGKVKITNALVRVLTEEDEGFERHTEVFEAIALSPGRG